MRNTNTPPDVRREDDTMELWAPCLPTELVFFFLFLFSFFVFRSIAGRCSYGPRLTDSFNGKMHSFTYIVRCRYILLDVFEAHIYFGNFGAYLALAKQSFGGGGGQCTTIILDSRNIYFDGI